MIRNVFDHFLYIILSKGTCHQDRPVLPAAVLFLSALIRQHAQRNSGKRFPPYEYPEGPSRHQSRGSDHQERLGVLAAPREVRSTFLIARLRSAKGYNY